MGIGWGLAGSTAISAIGSIFSGSSSAKSSKKAARIAAQGTIEASRIASEAQKYSIDKQYEMFQMAMAEDREMTAPWRVAGKLGLMGLGKEMAAGPGEFKPEETPGYEFGFKEFVERPYLQQQAARGKLMSGETMRGLTRYAQDYASTQYDKFLSRYYDRMRPYQSLAGLGQTGGSGNVANLAMQAGQGIGGTAMAGGQTMANLALSGGQMASQYQSQMGDIQSGAIAGVTGALQKGFSSYLDYKYGK